MAVRCQFTNSFSFTVGTLQELTCKGSFSSLNLPIQFQFSNPQKKYTLHLLEVKSFQPHELILTVTSYRPGVYQSLPFMVTDGASYISVDSLSWSVPSVIQKNSIPTPHPPYGPWKLDLPFWYYGAWGVLATLALSFIFIRIRNWRKKKQLILRVQQRLGDKTSLQYFIKQIGSFISSQKSLTSVSDDIQKLNECMREFLENEFYISKQDSMKSVLRHHQIKSDEQAVKILLELKRSLNSSSLYSKEDVEQLLGMVRSWIFDQNKGKVS